MEHAIDRFAVGVCGVVFLMLFGCSKERAAPKVRPRPVVVEVLTESAPDPGVTVTGVATPFREENLGFEVPGRVTFVSNSGREVSGPVLDQNQRVLPEARGDVVASLDTGRLEEALEAGRLKLQSAKRGLETRRVEVQEVAPAAVARAEAQEAAAREEVNAAQQATKAQEANLALARANLDRETNLVRSGSGTRAELDVAQRNFDTAQASLDQARSLAQARTDALRAAGALVTTSRAELALKAAQVAETEAQVAELQNAVVRAARDVDDAELRAPFTGRVTAQILGRGAIAGAGQPVLRLTMMDPIKIVITATGDESRRLPPGTRVRLRPRDLGDFAKETALWGIVVSKPEVADPATRTFRIEIMARNLTPRPAADGTTAVSPVDQVLPVLTLDPLRPDGPLFVSDTCIVRDGTQDLVLRLGRGVGDGAPTFRTGVPYDPDRIVVKKLERRWSVVSYSFVEVEAPELRAGDTLIVNPTPEHQRGVTLVAQDWVMRPGDLVPVSVTMGALPQGFYVPVDAIQARDGSHAVFLVENGSARRVAVTVHESSGDRRRVEGEGLRAGVPFITRGAHYVADGEPVSVTPGETKVKSDS